MLLAKIVSLEKVGSYPSYCFSLKILQWFPITYGKVRNTLLNIEGSLSSAHPQTLYISKHFHYPI